MRVPNELLHSVSSLPTEAPHSRVGPPPWADRVSRSLGEAPGIGAGVGLAALTAWFLGGSLPAPRHTSFAVAPPQSAAHAAPFTPGNFLPIAEAEPAPVAQQAETTAVPRDDHTVAVSVAPTRAATATREPVAAPQPTPTGSAVPSPTPPPTPPSPTPTPTQPAPSPGAAPNASGVQSVP